MTPEPNLTIVEGPDGTRSVQINARGLAVLDDPQVNRGTAFTMDERDHLGLHGLLPSGLETITEQVARCYEQFSQASSDVAKWVFLTQLHDSNEVLFYRLVGEHVAEMLPIVYTPTVGTAIQEFSHLFRRPRGVFLNIEDVDGIDRALDSTGLGPDDIDLVVASDAEAILGSATGASAGSTSRSASSPSTPSRRASTRAGSWPWAWTSARTASRC